MVKRSESSHCLGLRTEYVVTLGVRRSSCSSQLNWLRPSVRPSCHHSLAPLDPCFVPFYIILFVSSPNRVFVRRGYSLMRSF